VGIAVSVPLLLLVVLVYGYFIRLRTLPKKIVMNLAICLIISQLLFAVGISETDHENFCQSVALTLHYFLLAALMWALVEAFEIHSSFTAVFEVRRTRINLLLFILFILFLLFFSFLLFSSFFLAPEPDEPVAQVRAGGVRRAGHCDCRVRGRLV
jgi:hypothetical protein